MERKNESQRQRIIAAIVDALKPLDYVHAFYEGGAAAFDRIDEWSDIDLYAVVDDGKVEETFSALEKALNSVDQIDKKYPVLQPPWPGIHQAFYRLKNTSRYLLIDFAILTSESSEMFLEPEVHGNNVFYFNKPPMISPPSLNREKFTNEMRSRQERLTARFDMFNIFVQKEINRGNNLEAIDAYYNITLPSLVEILRAKYKPVHYNFKMRYIHYELPKEITAKLERLFFVKNPVELQSKYDEATKWLIELTSEHRTPSNEKGLRGRHIELE